MVGVLVVRVETTRRRKRRRELLRYRDSEREVKRVLSNEEKTLQWIKQQTALLRVRARGLFIARVRCKIITKHSLREGSRGANQGADHRADHLSS